MTTILLVEDDPAVISVTEELLVSAGYKVAIAISAEDALKRLVLGGIDIVFSDVRLGRGHDGYWLADEIHDILPDLPILLTSGYTNRVRLNNWPIIYKPYLLRNLIAAIKAVLAGNPGEITVWPH